MPQQVRRPGDGGDRRPHQSAVFNYPPWTLDPFDPWTTPLTLTPSMRASHPFRPWPAGGRPTHQHNYSREDQPVTKKRKLEREKRVPPLKSLQLLAALCPHPPSSTHPRTLDHCPRLLHHIHTHHHHMLFETVNYSLHSPLDCNSNECTVITLSLSQFILSVCRKV